MILKYRRSNYHDTAVFRFYRALAYLAMQSPVLASVRLSVTRWLCVKTTQARIAKSSTRTRTLVLAVKFKRVHPERGRIRDFQPISRRISETMQDITKVTISD